MMLNFIAVVMTKPKEKDGITKYQVNRRVSRLLSLAAIALTLFLKAHSTGSAYSSQLHGPASPTKHGYPPQLARWRTSRTRQCNPSRERYRLSLRLPSHFTPQRSHRRTVYLVRGIRPDSFRVAEETGGCAWAAEGHSGLE